ncbi:type VI secretion system protein TssA [Pseudomonas trivialis]|uniref:Type VI secretion system protein VasJ n=1 Tax=Pseudomonas trivialis TaxID=200450 RepID=A0ABY0UJ07_9PSED|nr:type VI secretion system protein TssA [Pseudomonas trivialis]SDS75659.1 type VI secretion system protein VasJ [Pseudomonas trivialis]
MDHLKTLCDYYLELARRPCSETSFIGCEVRFSSEYEALETELAKLQSIHGENQPDWQKIVETSECVLREHSKDLRVAVWLVWALYQRESFAGLLAGLGLLLHLCEQHWAVVYPIRQRTRDAAFGWLVLRLDPVFAQSLSVAGQQPVFHLLHEHLSRLDECWSQRMGHDAPLLLPIRRQLSERLEQGAQGNPAPAALPQVMTQVKQVAAQLLKPEPAIENEREANRQLRALQDQARPLCKWWLRQGAADLRALRLSRTLAWLSLTRYPDADNQRITTLRGPAVDKLKRCQERLAQGHYADLILEFDASLSSAMFWFDGLRMQWECLDALQANLAKTELEVSFALLLQRLPDLPEYRFYDGMPFADASTRDWIALHVARHLQTNRPLAQAKNIDAAPWETALQEGLPRLRKDGLKAVVGEFTQSLHAARSERDRFHWRLAQARLCVLAGKHELAKIQLEQLDDHLQQAGLERWEPELALQVAQLLFRCCERLPQDQAVRERKEQTHRRLCHFDLEAVLE